MNSCKTGWRTRVLSLLLVAVISVWLTDTFAGANENLIEAARHGNLPEIKTLLANKADVNVKATNVATAFLLASQKGYKDAVDVLRKHGAHE